MMTNVCFVVAGMDNRIHFLEDCIAHYKASQYNGIDIYLYFQGLNFDAIKGKDVFADVIIDSKPRGVFTPRYELMKRFGVNYDYVIVIDDDLFIEDGTDYWKTIKLLETNKNIGAACISESKAFVKNRVDIAGAEDLFNVRGGLILPRESVKMIINYFSDKEKDYSFDCFWLLIWVRGYDLAIDYRSYARHVCARKVNGEYSGFNASLVRMPYEPLLTEFFNERPIALRYGSYVRDIPTIKDANDLAIRTRLKNIRRRSK